MTASCLRASPVIEPKTGCCGKANLFVISEALTLSYEGGKTPRERPAIACVSCGKIGLHATVVFDALTLAKLRALDAIARGQVTSAEALGLPTLAAIAPHAKDLIWSTKADRRIEPDIDAVRLNQNLRDDLRRRLEDQMRVRLEIPRAAKAFGLGHPAIMHIGLAHKFVNDKHLDPGHIRFAGYIGWVLQSPLEIWRALEGDDTSKREVFHILGGVSVNPVDIRFMHIVVEAESSIVSTAFVADFVGHIESYRHGVPLHLRWAK